MQHNDDFITHWERLISEADKTDVPLECIKKVVIKLNGGRQKTINVHSLLRQGLDLSEVETMLNRFFGEQSDNIRDVDFVVDVSAVASLIQPETDKLLGKL